MATQGGEQTILALKKLGAVFLLIAGLALTAVGFANGSTGFSVAGLILVAASIVLLVLKIVRRNSLS